MNRAEEHLSKWDSLSESQKLSVKIIIPLTLLLAVSSIIEIGRVIFHYSNDTVPQTSINHYALLLCWGVLPFATATSWVLTNGGWNRVYEDLMILGDRDEMRMSYFIGERKVPLDRELNLIGIIPFAFCNLLMSFVHALSLPKTGARHLYALPSVEKGEVVCWVAENIAPWMVITLITSILVIKRNGGVKKLLLRLQKKETKLFERLLILGTLHNMLIVMSGFFELTLAIFAGNNMAIFGLWRPERHLVLVYLWCAGPAFSTAGWTLRQGPIQTVASWYWHAVLEVSLPLRTVIVEWRLYHMMGNKHLLKLILREVVNTLKRIKKL